MTDLEKRFLKNTDDTGRFIYQSLVTGRKYYVEPIGGHSDWGDINPATKKVPLSVIEERDKRYEQMAKK